MIIKADDREILNIDEMTKKLISDDVNRDIIDQDIIRRIKWIVQHKAEFNYQRLKKQWVPKLKNRNISIPKNPKALATVIFAQPDYKDAKTRVAEQEAQLLRSNQE